MKDESKDTADAEEEATPADREDTQPVREESVYAHIVATGLLT